MDAVTLAGVVLALGIFGIAYSVVRLHLDLKALRTSIENTPPPVVNVRLREKDEIDGIDQAAPQPYGPAVHDHIWGAQPFSEDSASRSFRCQYPRCQRVHTLAR